MSQEIDDDYAMYLEFCAQVGVEPLAFEQDFYVHWKQLQLGY
jgi:hypothetical protein